MHPLFKYTLLLLSAFAIPHSTFATESGLTLYNLENEETTLSTLAKDQPLFITLLDDIENPDASLRFITLVEGSQVSDRTHSIICIPLKTTNYLNRKSKLALINSHIKGDYMRSKLYLADAPSLEKLLQSHRYALLSETTPIWLSHTSPNNEQDLVHEILSHPLFSSEK